MSSICFRIPFDLNAHSCWKLLGCVSATIAIGLARGPLASAEEFTVKKTDSTVEVKQGDEAFATYHFQSGAKPIIWPIYGPSGSEMTRRYPMSDAGPSERNDHVHHRSLWFTHGEVNGVDFWGETEGHGVIKQRELLKAEGGEVATIETANDWLDAQGNKVLTDRTRFVFGGDSSVRWIDCDFTLLASQGDVHFGDTKEGSFGVRVAGTMKVDAKQGGQIVNSKGEKNDDAWGKQASWCDYFGPVDGKTQGIAILNHPSSFHYPCRWHVRTYGLFAANPFGHHHFVGEREKTDGVRLKQGDSIVLRYRVLLHQGDATQAHVDQEFAKYQATQIQGP